MGVKGLVTVGVALYNHEKYIAECLASIVSQSYRPVELIVIDDGSPDGSYEAAKAYLESQTRLENYTLKTRPNRGMCRTLNEIAEMAQGEYIAFIGSDDYWAPEKLEAQVAFLEAHPEHALVHSNSYRVDGEGNRIEAVDFGAKINSGMIFEAIVRGTGGINTASHLYRTSVYDTIGYYDPDFRFEDTDFWLRLTRNFSVGFIDACHSYYRWHGENLSDGKNKLRFYNEELIRIFRKNIDDPKLRRYAVAKMYRKSLLLALRTGAFGAFVRNLGRYLGCRYLGRC